MITHTKKTWLEIFTEWLDTFVEEKGLGTCGVLEVTGERGVNFIPFTILLDAIKTTSEEEQKGIQAMIVKIDFYNADVMDYFRQVKRPFSRQSTQG